MLPQEVLRPAPPLLSGSFGPDMIGERKGGR
jgi:hypothetical protein